MSLDLADDRQKLNSMLRVSVSKIQRTHLLDLCILFISLLL